MRQSTAEHLALGAAAGLAGTVLLNRIRGISQRLSLPKPPVQTEPGKYMVGQVESALPEAMRERIPAGVENAAAESLAFGYGATFGALYGLVRPGGGAVLGDGAVLGLVAWAAGFVGWLPVVGLMPPVAEQKPAEVAVPVVQHVLFGIATVAAYDGLHDLVAR